MKEAKIKIQALLMCLGILASVVAPFIYWFKNPHLSQMEVFKEIWWIHLGGILIVFLTIVLAGDDEEKGVPKMRNPPPPPGKKASIKDVYEYLETRAENIETINDCFQNEAFPLYVSINEIYHVLSMYHHGEFGQFLRTKGLCYDHGFGCDADDFNLPEFPASPSKKPCKYPDPPEPPPARRIIRL